MARRLLPWLVAPALVGGTVACRRSTDQPVAGESAGATAEELRRRVEADPADAKALLELGNALRDSNPAESARFLRKALSADPKSDAWKSLADLYQARGYADRTLEVCEQHLAASPDDVAAMVRLIPLLLDVGDRKTAVEWGEKARALAPRDPEVVETLANLQYTAVKFGDAAREFAPLVEGDSVPAERWNRYSELLRAAGRYDEALVAVDKAIAGDPEHGPHHRQRAHILATREPSPDFDSAALSARKAVQLGDNTLDAKYWLAVSIAGQRKNDEALAAFETVAQEDVSYEQVAFKLGTLYLRSGKVAQGRELLKLHDTMSNNERELALARRRVREHPEQLANHYKLATLLMQADDASNAIAVLRRARRRFPTNRAVQDALAQSLESAGRKTEAGAVRDGKDTESPAQRP